MIEKPLYVVDMTLYEFKHILKLISKIKPEYSLKERKSHLRREINDMFGKIRRDIGKGPRHLSAAKNKMTSNFMITINQLGILENLYEFNNLYYYLDSNHLLFYEKLRKILLFKGNWNIYLKIIERINQRGIFKNKTEYLNLVAKELHRKFPRLSVKGHKKRLTNVFRWMKNENLKIIGEFSSDGMKIF